MFVYCNNNPINYYDPNGEDAFALLWGWITGAGSVAAAEPTLIGEIIVGLGVVVIGTAVVGEKIVDGIKYIGTLLEEEDDAPHSITEPETDKNGNPVVKPGQQPTEKEGYVAPKGGPVKAKTKDGKVGWKDKNGNIWVPAPTDSPQGHGGGHWDVQSPGGGYSNVYPGGKIRGGKAPFPRIKIY